MGLVQEKFVEEFCDAWGDGSFERKPDVEKILSMMSEDAEWQLWVPGGPIINRLCPPAAATSSARLAVSCPLMSRRSAKPPSSA